MSSPAKNGSPLFGVSVDRSNNGWMHEWGEEREREGIARCHLGAITENGGGGGGSQPELAQKRVGKEELCGNVSRRGRSRRWDRGSFLPHS